MSQLDKIIREKILEDMAEIFDPLHKHILAIERNKPIKDILYVRDKNNNLKEFSLSLLSTLVWKAVSEPEFKISLQYIKLKYYKRN